LLTEWKEDPDQAYFDRHRIREANLQNPNLQEFRVQTAGPICMTRHLSNQSRPRGWNVRLEQLGAAEALAVSSCCKEHGHEVLGVPLGYTECFPPDAPQHCWH
jgi:hypothetical protein